MLPVLEVSRLSSASSFYSSVSQTLGLAYLPSNDHPASLVSASATALVKHNPVLTFGDPSSGAPVFQVRQVDNRTPRPATLVLSASSLDAVNNFHAAALRAFPRSSAVIGTKESLSDRPETKRHIIPSVDDYFSSSAPHAGAASGSDPSTIVARVTDFDGNTMAVEYYPYQSSSYGRSSASRYGTSRVLDYSTTSPDAASPSMFSPRYTSNGASAMTTISTSRSHRGTVTSAEMPASYYDPYAASRNDRTGTLRRSATSASAASYESDPSTSASNKGGMGVFGLAAAGAVGAMAGAAITYTVMRSRSRTRGTPTREYPYEYDDKYNDQQQQQQQPPLPAYDDAVPSLQRRETAPAAMGYDEYPDRYAAPRDSGGMRSSRTRSVVSHKDLRPIEDVYDYKDADSIAPPPSYHTRYSRAPSTHARSSRSRSEAPVDRAPLMLTNGSEKGPFDGYDYGHGYDSYEKRGYDNKDYEKSYAKSSYDKDYEKGYEKSYAKSSYDKDGYDKDYEKSYAKSSYDKGGYEKSGYEKSGYEKGGYDKASYVSARTERSRVPPNSSRSAPIRASSYAASHAYSQQPSQAPSRRSRSSSRSRHGHGHSYNEYGHTDSQATLTRSSSSRVAPSERPGSQTTMYERAESIRKGSSGRSYMSQAPSHRSSRHSRHPSESGRGRRWEDDDGYSGADGYDDDEGGDADSVAPDDSISCVGLRGRY